MKKTPMSAGNSSRSSPVKARRLGRRDFLTRSGHVVARLAALSAVGSIPPYAREIDEKIEREYFPAQKITDEPLVRIDERCG